MANSESSRGDAATRDVRTNIDGLSLDVLFDALADRRRRRVLRCLREYRTPMALADLADEVAAREQELPVPEVPPGEAERVYASLSHAHLPKLADANVVEYDRERGSVALSENSERAEPLLECARTDE